MVFDEVMVLDIPGLESFDLRNTQQSPGSQGKSVSNPAHVAVTVALLRAILRRAEDCFSPQDIMILAPYRAQASLYKTALQDENLKNPKLGFENVKIDTIDRFQGGECPIVFLDLVVTDRIGFLGEPGRVCTALSRAKCVLYIIGNFRAMNEALKRADDKQQFFKNVLQVLERDGLVRQVKWAGLG